MGLPIRSSKHWRTPAADRRSPRRKAPATKRRALQTNSPGDGVQPIPQQAAGEPTRRQTAPQKAAPPSKPNHPSANSGSDIGSKTHSDARNTHNSCLFIAREGSHNDTDHHRHGYARRYCLESTTGYQHLETGSNHIDSGAYHQQQQCRQHHIFQRKTAHEVGNRGNSDSQHQHVQRSNPLAQFHLNAKVCRHTGKHGVQRGLRKIPRHEPRITMAISIITCV